MGAFGELFGFDGRINRLGYLWRALAGAALIGIGVALAAFAVLFVLRPQSIDGAQQPMQWLIVGATLAGLWNGFALITRRLRDMGLEPAHVVPLFAALWVVNEVLLAPLSQLQPRPYRALEDGWLLAQAAAALLLLVWPSRAPTAAPAPRYEPAAPTSALNWRQSG
jgi:uncharacterized membrane protein YhaH (DUF805 family)